MGFTRNEVTNAPRGLLHLGSILACAACAAIGGPFLWHYPSARADWTLSSILPYGARTFLPWLAPPAIVCQTSRTTLNIIQTCRIGHKSKSVEIANNLRTRTTSLICASLLTMSFFKLYRNRKGSVSSSEACTAVAYLCSASFSAIHSATFSFMIFSALCPGSISVIPARWASIAVW